MTLKENFKNLTNFREEKDHLTVGQVTQIAPVRPALKRKLHVVQRGPRPLSCTPLLLCGKASSAVPHFTVFSSDAENLEEFYIILPGFYVFKPSSNYVSNQTNLQATLGFRTTHSQFLILLILFILHPCTRRPREIQKVI